MPKLRLPFVWFCVLFFILFYIVQNVNHRFWLNDFKVYYLAAENLLAGRPFYGQVFGLATGFYKYSPAALLFFVPFTFLPFFWAATLYFALVAALVYFLIKKSATFPWPCSRQPRVNPELVSYLLLLIAGVHFYRELHLGNVNVILLLIAMAALTQLTNNIKIVPGLLIGIVIIVKPQFLIVLPLLLLYRYFLPLGISLAVIAAGLLLPALKIGFKGNAELIRQWVGAMAAHNTPGALAGAPNTINHWIAMIIPVHASLVQALSTLLCLCLFYGAILLIKIKHDAKAETGSKNIFPLAFCGLVAFIPNITVTDTEHFLFCLPMIGYLLALFPQQRLVMKIATIAALIAYGSNWHDAWGHQISVALENAGLLGFGNLAIIILAFVSYFIFNSNPAVSYFTKTSPNSI